MGMNALEFILAGASAQWQSAQPISTTLMPRWRQWKESVLYGAYGIDDIKQLIGAVR